MSERGCCTTLIRYWIVMLAYWLDYAFFYLQPSSISWRFPIACQNLFCIIILLGVPFLPESPRWLMLKGRRQEATAILSALHDLDESDITIQEEIAAMGHAIELAARARFRDLFKQGRVRTLHRVVLAYCAQLIQQLTGINVIAVRFCSDRKPLPLPIC